jgi:hypothetical protein
VCRRGVLIRSGHVCLSYIHRVGGLLDSAVVGKEGDRSGGVEMVVGTGEKALDLECLVSVDVKGIGDEEREGKVPR